ncbi:MAG: thioredoxin [Clostridiales bacterium]|nr:thioredoxin [Clostridiales bacterium]
MSIQIGTTENFDAIINGELPVLADFWASWCGPCRMLMPMVEALAEEYAGKLTVLKINVDEEPGLAARYSVTTIPTLILLKGGQVLDRSVGARPKHLLQAFVEKAM